MNIQQQWWNHESLFHSKLDLHHGFNQGCTNQLKEETTTAHILIKKQSSSRSSPPDQKALEVAPILSNPSAAPSAHNVFIQLTSLTSSIPLSRPNRVKYLLNPTARDTTGAGGHQDNGNEMHSRWTAPIAATSQPATPPPTVMRKGPSGDVFQPSITLALMNQHPHPPSRSTTPRSPTGHGPYFITTGPLTAAIDARQTPALLPQDQASALTESGSLLPSEIMTASSMLDAAHPPPVPLPRPSPRVQTQFIWIRYPAS